MIIQDYKSIYIDRGEYPDIFANKKRKKNKEFIKGLCDYFYNVAVGQYKHNCRTIANNYRLLKGDLVKEDFYEESLDKDTFLMVEELTEDVPLPKYVQSYSVMSQPINTMCGELSSRPDDWLVRAFDDDSKNEHLEYRTKVLNDIIVQKIRQDIYGNAEMNGADINNPEILEMMEEEVMEKAKEQISTYTTAAEKWGNKILEALQAEFSFREKSEEVFYDLLACGYPRMYLRRDKSKTGFTIDAENPKNTWICQAPEKKYTKDAFAGGIIKLMDISEIIDRFDLSKEEVDALREEHRSLMGYSGNLGDTSNLFKNRTGVDSIDYNVKYQMAEQEQMFRESYLFSKDSDTNFDIFTGSKLSGQMHIVLEGYVLMKEKIGLLTYVNEEGLEVKDLVNEDYKDGEHPNEISIEWGYQNQWYQFHKIGDYVYDFKPFELLPYFPIIGMNYLNKNSKVKGLVDLMKPFQALANLVVNQAWELFQKEKGKIVEFNLRRIPRGADQEHSEAIKDWMDWARELGIVFNDDSPENMEAPSSNTNTTKVLDLTLSDQIRTRFEMFQRIKMECHSLIGITPERLGGINASSTATGVSASLEKSYSQTEPWFSAIESVLNMARQAILDAAVYIESHKEDSTISWITSPTENSFIEINGSSLLLKDLRCITTTNPGDVQKLVAMQSLVQPMLQNGGDFFTASEMLVSRSIRNIQAELRKDKIKKEDMFRQQQEAEQRRLEQEASMFEAQMQEARHQKELDRADNNLNKQLDRISKEKVALLNAAGRDKTVLEDRDNSGIADALELTKREEDIAAANSQFALAQSKITNENNINQAKIRKDKIDQDLKLKELDIKEKEIQAKLKISEDNLKIASKNKNKYDK